jgi:hypothetical protein
MKRSWKRNRAGWTVGTAIVIFCAAGMAHAAEAPVLVAVEAESAATNAAIAIPVHAGWNALALTNASGGQVLTGGGWGLRESKAIPVAIPRAGRYRVWVRYHKSVTNICAFMVLFRDEGGEELAFHACDWCQYLPTETPYDKPAGWSGARVGFIWEPFEAAFERPVRAALSFGAIAHGGGGSAFAVDCVVIAGDPAFNPEGQDIAKLVTGPPAAAPALPAAPAGFVWSEGLPAHADFYAGVKDPAGRFYAGLVNNASYFIDGARMVRLGFNRDHADGISAPHGIFTAGHVEAYHGGPELARHYPMPEGRFVNADGQTGTVFSFHFPPIAESSAKALAEHVKRYMEGDESIIGWWRISVEDGGYLDYSTNAVAAFRAWLTAKHGTVAKLNERWGTAYGSIAEIAPPAKFEENRPGWLEFRDFCGHAYAEAVSRQMPVLRRIDPKNRPRMGANSNLDMFSPYFSKFRPLDYEEFIHVALAGEPFVSWDTYCADDQLAAETDFIDSIAEGRKMIIQEWSNHVCDPRIAARSYWTYVSKGVAGIHLFMFQEGTYHSSYPKWALLSADLSPKAKLVAYSDAVQEVHRLEPLLMAARYTHAVKPVALYWSRIDLSLEPPHESLYGCALDSPFHIYRTLRGLGYPVRFITPRQIAAGELDKVAAVVLAGANHVPRAAAEKLEAWVKAGGAVIGDQWPGGWDDYAQPQGALTPVFGVRAATKKQKGSALALQQSTQGYGEVTDAAVVRQHYYEKVEEIAQQPGATHPVARALGDFMVSGIGLEPVECFAGRVIGMTHGGQPGFVLNDYGKGKALYSCLLLGTVYESGGTRFEWDTTHAGLAYARVLDAFLKYAGVQPGSAATGLAPRVRAKLRVESPLVTPDGNLVIGLTSLNDDALGPFDLDVVLPAAARTPFTKVFAVTEGSRRLYPLEAKANQGWLAVRLPRFDTHAALVALKEAAPLVSLELQPVRRGIAGLAAIDANQSFEIEAVVYNPSARKLAAGELALTMPAGWLQSATQAKIGAIKAGGEERCSFRVRAPALAAAKRIVPLTARYRNASVTSTPTTEMVWWGAESQADNETH